MSATPHTYTPQEITQYMKMAFAGPLITSTFGFILYGANCYQFFMYIQETARKDPRLTRSWISTLFVLNTAATFHQVYFNWTYSIIFFTISSRASSIANGNVVILYSVVVMLCQMFWIACVDQMSNDNTNIWVVGPLATFSFLSFSVAIAVGADSAVNFVPGGAWPTDNGSILLRSVLCLDLGVDLVILAVMLAQLRRMKKERHHLRKTLSKLSYIFLAMAALSTLCVVGEVIVSFPRTGNSNWLAFTFSFAAIIAPLYTCSVLSILNARGEAWSDKPELSSSAEDDEMHEENRRPQMNFTNEVYSRAAGRESRQLPLRNHAATEPANDIERVVGSRRSSVEGCDDQRRYSIDGSADQIQSTQFGIQTI